MTVFEVSKIVAKNFKTLVTGSSNRLPNALVKNLLAKGCQVFTADKRVFNEEKIERLHFEQIDLAQEKEFRSYLQRIGPVDALVNCAGYKSSYNYFLSYLISKNILEKFKENEINKFGCRGCIINLVYLSNKYNEEYFKKQEKFIETYKIDTQTVDEDVFRLADLLTAARVRCNTVMVNEKTDNKTFVDLITHIIEDQYIAGQVINLEDDLPYQERDFPTVFEYHHQMPVKVEKDEEKYFPPLEKQITSGDTKIKQIEFSGLSSAKS